MVVVNKSLRGLNVVVTRPLAQAQNLSHLIHNAGGNPILFPTIEIIEPTDKRSFYTALRNITQFEIAIFTSINAVNCLLQVQADQLQHLQIVAVGSATAKALEKLNFNAIIPDTEYSSEGLLELPLLQDVKGKRVAIFSGEGGRDVLIELLSQRGANVTKVNCYGRKCPQLKEPNLLAIWQKLPIHIIISTSNESLTNLCLLLEPLGSEWLFKQQLLVISQRMVTHAQNLGFKLLPIVTSQAHDQAILDTLITWYTSDKLNEFTKDV